MKLHNIVRTQLMLMGLGAALLLAGSAYAQQDMDPIDFPINPGTPQIERSAVQPTAQSVAPAKVVNAENLVSTVEMIVVEGALVLALLAGIASFTLYAVAATKRDSASIPSCKIAHTEALARQLAETL